MARLSLGKPPRLSRAARTALLLALLLLIVSAWVLWRGGDPLHPRWLPRHSTGVGRDRWRGSVERHFLSSVLLSGQTWDYYVYLPPSYYRPGEARRRYPVLYLLHGTPGASSNWLLRGKLADTVDRLLRQRRLRPLIVVMPEGNGGWLKDSEYVNRWDGRENVEDYLVYDLVQEVDIRFRTRPNQRWRALGGISEGGYGAMNLGLKHREVFGAILCHSGYFRALDSWPERLVFGDDANLKRRNSPLDYLGDLGDLGGTAIYLDAGTERGLYRAQAEELHRRLKALGIPHEFHLFPGGHNWAYWSQHLVDSLGFLERVWRQRAAREAVEGAPAHRSRTPPRQPATENE